MRNQNIFVCISLNIHNLAKYTYIMQYMVFLYGIFTNAIFEQFFLILAF